MTDARTVQATTNAVARTTRFFPLCARVGGRTKEAQGIDWVSGTSQKDRLPRAIG